MSSRPHGIAAASRGSVGSGRGGWLGVVVGTGMLTGALGFVLGYGLAGRERAALDQGAFVAPQAAPAAAVARTLSGATSTGSESSAGGRSGARSSGLAKTGATTPSELEIARAEVDPGQQGLRERIEPIERRAAVDPGERAGHVARAERTVAAPPGAPPKDAIPSAELGRLDRARANYCAV